MPTPFMQKLLLSWAEHHLQTFQRLAIFYKHSICGARQPRMATLQKTLIFQAFGTIQDLQFVRDAQSASSSSIHCSSFLDDKVFLTNDNTPIITLAEYQTVIQAAEDFAKKTGWTTSLHYAVPTTDIPLHELESLVSWFRCCWDKQI